MSTYFYRAINEKGEVVEATISALDENEVIRILKEKKLSPLIIKETKQDKPKKFVLRKSIGRQEITNFTSQLASLLSAGLPLAKALETLESQAVNPKLKSLISDLNQMVSQGKSFSEALSKYPQYFSNLYQSMVRAGEVGGMLEKALTQIAEGLERDEELRSRIKGALTYPAIMLVVMIISIIVLLTFVVPRFTGIFQEMGRSLPLPTKILIGISSGLKTWWWLLSLLVFGIGFGFWWYIRTENGRLVFDKTKLKIPLIGSLVKEVALSRLSLTLGSLLASGVNILQALEVTRDVAGNKKISQALNVILKDVQEGSSLSKAMTNYPDIFPSFVIGMVGTGEEGGNLPEMLVKIGTYYDKRTSSRVKALTTVLEPIIILGMGVLVGFIIIAMLLPIFEMTSMIR